ncbi:MAG: hypothetical protein KatS3mg024_2657 [Armatimonadota bacterium]|nr:MAG: hypothetical protein KatS3mg024_2657 [Armatimonadota bacterium]
MCNSCAFGIAQLRMGFVRIFHRLRMRNGQGG